jgi:group I intron endonuclease
MVVYYLYNRLNGKMYIGQTSESLRKRLNGHLYGDQIVDRAIDKYGIGGFIVGVIKECSSFSEMNDVEEYWIRELNTQVNCGYNIRPGGNNSPMAEISKNKISLVFKGKKRTAESRIKQSMSISGEKNHFYGKKHSIDTLKKIREGLLGEKHPLYGKKRPKEACENISKGKLGKKFSEEHKEALRLAWLVRKSK